MTIAEVPISTGVEAQAPDAPRVDECLVCFVLRRLESVGCDNTLRWARVYRDVAAPGDRGLERRLAARGGYCDCEVLSNVFVLAASDADDDPDDDWLRLLPDCGGVRPGSTVPCRHWAAASYGRP
ncbi:hypothetical protein JCM18899A_48300 [Nocardioides sp. AN3]